MSDTMIVSVLAPTIATILGGVGYVLKKKFDDTIKTRNERRAKIEERQDRMEEDLNMMQSMLASCDNPDCKVRPMFAEYLRKRTQKINNN